MRSETPRARRLLLTLPITYRTVDDGEWLRGRIVNVSESGVLFAPADVEPGMNVEVIFTTPVPIDSIAPGRLICSGTVVRVDSGWVAAACFDECRFLLEPGPGKQS